MKFEIPHPLKVEHEELHESLRRATKENGELGEAARAVAGLLHPHFIRRRNMHCLRSAAARSGCRQGDS